MLESEEAHNVTSPLQTIGDENGVKEEKRWLPKKKNCVLQKPTCALTHPLDREQKQCSIVPAPASLPSTVPFKVEQYAVKFEQPYNSILMRISVHAFDSSVFNLIADDEVNKRAFWVTDISYVRKFQFVEPMKFMQSMSFVSFRMFWRIDGRCQVDGITSHQSCGETQDGSAR